MISLMFLIGSRFVIKLWYIESVKSDVIAERVMIFGAGTMGMIAKRTIENDHQIEQKIIGFLDHQNKLIGNRIDGLKVYDPNNISTLIEELRIEKVIVAIRTPDRLALRNLVEQCLAKKIKIQRVQDPNTWVNGELTPKKIGKINIEDLLGRAHIHLDHSGLKEALEGKSVLVTGAAGSIGSGIVKELLRYPISELILLDQSESPLYDLQQALQANKSSIKIKYIIGDIRNKETVQQVFQLHQPKIVFHAAAYKHVPLMEGNPSEAIHTNVAGTMNVVDASKANNVEKFVFISTDKAVNPTNIMGASKRIAEMYAQLQNEKGRTKFITTRFGNVLGSNGSVIPLFQRQIEKGGPVTVTDDRITRFFMTIPEACQLVLEALNMGNGGEIFVFDMGESVKIIDLARKMIQLHGLEPGKDIELKISGLRPGEKLYEELLADTETTLPTHHPKILIAKTREVEANFEALIPSLIQPNLNELALVRIMKTLVPEFISQNSTFTALDDN